MLRLLAISLIATLAPGCVINRPARPSMPESAQGPSAQAVTGSPVVARMAPPDDDDDATRGHGKPGATWMRGYWHWDGVRYVWERGHWVSSVAAAGH